MIQALITKQQILFAHLLSIIQTFICSIKKSFTTFIQHLVPMTINTFDTNVYLLQPPAIFHYHNMTYPVPLQQCNCLFIFYVFEAICICNFYSQYFIFFWVILNFYTVLIYRAFISEAKKCILNKYFFFFNIFGKWLWIIVLISQSFLFQGFGCTCVGWHCVQVIYTVVPIFNSYNYNLFGK